jgi:hypothetical protein
MTADNATAMGYDTSVKCSSCSCGTDPSGLSKYCYGKKLYADCTECGSCVLDTMASNLHMFPCPDTTLCAPQKHCYTPCVFGSGCNCLQTVVTSDNLTKCSEDRCVSLSGPFAGNCYRCPDGCECKSDNDTDIANYESCDTGRCDSRTANDQVSHCYRYVGGKSGTSVSGCTPPQINYLSSSGTQISAGQQVVLSWSITGSGNAFLNCGSQQRSVPLTGSMSVTPPQSGCCTLSVKNDCGSDQKTVCITVVPSPVSEPVGGCCANGRVGQATQSQCAQIGGQWYRSLSEATQACQPPTCWCCANGRVSQVTQSQCAQMGGACYSDQSQATKACQPVTCWCCANGRVYQTTQPQCAQMGGACYNDQGQATKACQQAPTPPRDTR